MNENETTIIPEGVIVNKIYLIRGKKVMMDKDLAELYNVKPIRLREQVKRNIDRFPESFMFQLTEDETNIMVSQNAIPSKKHLGGYLPFVFTEHGVLMLANIIKNPRAVKMSIRIIEVFVRIREMLVTHQEILYKLEELQQKDNDQDEKIKIIFEYIKQLESSKQEELEFKNRPRIGFKSI